MVRGIPELKSRFAKVVPRLEASLRQVLEAEARSIVAQMDRVKPIPEIEINWTWGRAPRGAVTVGQVRPDPSGPRITIYATATTTDRPGGFPGVATWFEFGTAERFHKNGKSTGAIDARPYFFPTYRANRDGVRRKIRARINKEVRNL